MDVQAHKELLKILQDPLIKDNIRARGFQHVLGLSVTEEGLYQIIIFQEYIPFFVKFIENSQANYFLLELAHKCLINISANNDGASDMIKSKEDLIPSLLNKICNADYRFTDYTCYILSNLAACHKILQQKDSITDSNLLNKLLENFLSAKEEIRDKYKFLALFFAAISGYPEIINTLINNESFITSFVHHINLNDPFVRRLGVAVTLRNLCSQTSIHNLLIERDVLSVLLLPLMGPEEYEEEHMEKLPLDCQYLENSKQRESVPQIRRALVQALSLLCYTEGGWNYLITHSVYFVIRDLHKWETDPTTKEAIETLVGFLLVEQYGEIYSAPGGGGILTASVTEIVKDLPDFLLL